MRLAGPRQKSQQMNQCLNVPIRKEKGPVRVKKPQLYSEFCHYCCVCMCASVCGERQNESRQVIYPIRAQDAPSVI